MHSKGLILLYFSMGLKGAQAIKRFSGVLFEQLNEFKACLLAAHARVNGTVALMHRTEMFHQ